MKQENERIISGETQPETTILGGDFVKNGAAIQESFGSNSTLEVNLHKGNLFFTQHLFTAQGLHLPASFSVAYYDRFADTNYVHNQTTMFMGWKLNYQQFIRFVDNKCVYVDGAFKEHVFEKSTNNANVYLDTSTQSGAILRPVSGGYEIFDGANTTLLFQSNRLVKITQAKGATPIETAIAYDSTGRVSQVTDGLGKTYTVAYENAVEIKDSNNVVLVTLTPDDENHLATIKYYEDNATNKQCLFSYKILTQRITSVQDQLAQEKLSFNHNVKGNLLYIKKYASKNNADTPLHSAFLTYGTNTTIVSKNNGTDTNYKQIRYKYNFESTGTLVSVYEIDATGNRLGPETRVDYSDGIERQTVHDDNNIIDLIGLLDGVDIPSNINPDIPYEVCNQTILLPKVYASGLDLQFNWKLFFDNYQLPSNQGTISVECFVNGYSVDNRTLNFTDDFPVSHTVLVKDVLPSHTAQGDVYQRLLNIKIVVKHSYTENPLQLRSATVQYIPIAKKEVRIKYTPSNIASLPKYYITEEQSDGNVHWFPIGSLQFVTSGTTVTPTCFTVADYQKTMLSYFQNPSNFNLFYNDCKNVLYGISSFSVYKDQQSIPFDQQLFAIVATATLAKQSFTHLLTDGTHLRTTQRTINPLVDMGYTQYDHYLRAVEEWRPGMTITNYQYDNYGNLVDTFVGGLTGLRSTSAFSTNGQYLAEVPNYISPYGPKTVHTYDTNGLLTSTKTPNNQTCTFEYQNRNLLTTVRSAIGSDVNENNISYDGLFVTSLSHNNTQFNFEYDNHNAVAKIKLQNVDLLSKVTTYDTNGDHFTINTYANGYVEKTYYDKYGRVIKVSDCTTNEQVLAKYLYSDKTVPDTITEPTYDNLHVSASSKLRVVIDNTSNTRTNYIYNEAGGFVRTESDSFVTVHGWDEHGRIKTYESVVDKLNHVGINKVFYASDTDNTVTAETAQVDYDSPFPITTTYTNDSLKRPTETKVMLDNCGHKYTYGYLPRQSRTWVPDGLIIHPSSIDSDVASPNALGGYWQITTDGETSYISEFKEYSMSGSNATLVRTDNITYDANGNITKYGNVTYQYDGLNRLTRENNLPLDKTTVWSYDVGGNITSKTEYAYTTGALGTPTNTFTYVYDQSWKDQLVEVKKNGETQYTFDYDQVGNPTTYRGKTLAWTRGRLLVSYNSITMQYDANGIRREKVVPTSSGSATTTYLYQGNNLIKQVQTGTNPQTLIFLYNAQGVIGFAQGSNTYTYRKNLFGDITSIYNGQDKVAEYKYDAWGNCTITLDTDGIGTANPFRYRGYYYDADLGLYYLMSRYYDAQTGRFISAASTSALNPYAINGLNLYSYASNNPINIAHNGTRTISAMSSTPVLQGTIYNNTENYRLLPDGFLYDTLGLASDVFGILNALDVAHFLFYNPNKTKSVRLLLKEGPYGKISNGIGYAAAVLDGLNVMEETHDFGQGVLTGLYNAGSVFISGEIGTLIGAAIGGIPGAIIGTIVGMALNAVFQYFKENIVSLVDDALDVFWGAVFGTQNKLANA